MMKACEHCEKQFMCKGKYFRDLLLDNTRAFINVVTVMAAIAESCSEYKEME
jgi:hypothetical protein